MTLFIISAPSGTGKSSLIKRLLNTIPNLTSSKSFTTRAKRTGEVEGEKYFFISKDQFQKKISEGDFVEYAEVFGNLYGTSKSYLSSEMSAGRDVIIEIDYQGKNQIKASKLADHCVSIFIKPPSIDALRERIISRNDATQNVEIRLESAKLEIDQAPSYDYIVVNDNFETAVLELTSIISNKKFSS